MTTYFVDGKAKGKGDHSSPDNAGLLSTVWDKLEGGSVYESSNVTVKNCSAHWTKEKPKQEKK